MPKFPEDFSKKSHSYLYYNGKLAIIMFLD